jgi:hypothetical protein
VRTYRLQNESRRACPELVERGRLNLAQDAVLGRNSRDEKSRRDDWKLLAGDPRREFATMLDWLFSVVPCGTLPWRNLTQDCVG